jgi:hypothetical protein
MREQSAEADARDRAARVRGITIVIEYLKLFPRLVNVHPVIANVARDRHMKAIDIL